MQLIIIVKFKIGPLSDPVRYHGQPQVRRPAVLLCPCLIARGQQSLAAPPLGPMAVVSFALLLLSGPCPRLSLLASGLGCSFLFLQEPLPFLLYAHPRTSPARLQLHHIRRRTPKPGLCNLSSIVSSNSVTKNKSHYSSSQS